MKRCIGSDAIVSIMIDVINYCSVKGLSIVW